MAANVVTSYKELKEEFVRGSSGTSPWQIMCICSSPAVGLFCYENLLKTSNTASSKLVPIVAEIVSFWIPMLLSQTIWFDTYGKVYMILQIAMGSCIIVWHRRKHRRIASDCETLDCKRTSVSIYRGCLYFMTFIAILAVDFHAFPRTLMKTEETGYSLMDLGAASFVVAAGWVSQRARYYAQQQNNHDNHHHHHHNLLQRIVPILGMGLIRLLAHKQVEYPEHVTEYGVHWNFFFTMAFLTFYSTMGSTTASSPPSLVAPLLMLAIYQWVLSGLGQIWVEKSPRYWEGTDTTTTVSMIGWNWFVANREGVLGCIGYASLYGITEWIAYYYFWHAPQMSSLAPLFRRARSSKRLWVVSIHVLLIWRLATYWIEPSRRTTNASFVVWVLCINVLQMAAIHSIVTKNNITHRPPMILSAISRNGFLLFVIANLLTGAVNLSINTLEVNDHMAVFYVTLYITLIGIIAVALDRVKQYVPNRRKRETHPHKD